MARYTGMLDLTPRELEILRSLSRGWSNTRIAQNHWLSIGTIENHISNIYSKLDVTGYPGINPRVMAAIIYRDATQGE